jgi:lipopolysaccharide export system protein LptC
MLMPTKPPPSPGAPLSAGRAAPSRAAPQERVYRAALRHSRFVRVLKVAIPFGATIAVGAIAFIGIFDPFRRLEGVTLGPLTLSGREITMESPALTGYDKESRPYEVRAEAAVQDVKKPTVISLKKVKGNFALEGASKGWMEALTGILDTQTEKLTLKQDIHIKTDTGHDVKLRSASVDFKAKSMVSRDPVEVTLPNGRIDANTLEITDNGKAAAFVGDVRTFMESTEPSGKAPAKPKDGDGTKRSPLSGLSGTAKDPIKINSERLDIFERDKKVVFSGKVETVQGETTMRCTTMTIHYEQAAKVAGAPKTNMGGMTDGNSSITKMECAGPVDVVAKDQKASGDNAIYDKAADRVYLVGNAKVSQGENVMTGERLTYELTASHARVEGGRVKAMFTPKEKDDKPQKASKADAKKALPFATMGGDGKDPIKVDADKLDVFYKERKAVFAGEVVAVRGETTMRCSVLTVFYEKREQGETPAKASDGNGLRKLDCSGPVTVISKDQIGTGDNATYDKTANKIFLIGNAKLSQGENVTIGEKVVYDLTTSQASVETRPGERVKALINPKNSDLSKSSDAVKPKGSDAKGASQTN